MTKTRSDKKIRIVKLVVSMREVEGLTFQQIGKELGLTKQRTHKIYHDFTQANNKKNTGDSEEN